MLLLYMTARSRRRVADKISRPRETGMLVCPAKSFLAPSRGLQGIVNVAESI